jgi:hypothetical protein
VEHPRAALTVEAWINLQRYSRVDLCPFREHAYELFVRRGRPSFDCGIFIGGGSEKTVSGRGLEGFFLPGAELLHQLGAKSAIRIPQLS